MDIVGWLLVLGLTLRLTRFVITDTLGKWWIHDPLDRAMASYAGKVIESHANSGNPGEPPTPWWWKYRVGLNCPYCVGFWISGAVALSYLLVGDTVAWRFVAGVFTLNWVASHVGARLGDAEGHDD